MKVTSITIGLPVKSTSSALSWYEKLFGQVPQIHPATGVAEMEISPGAWLQVMDASGEETPARVLRIGVENLADELERLERAGVRLEPPRTFVLADHGVLKLAYIDDPDGNRLCFYEMSPETRDG